MRNDDQFIKRMKCFSFIANHSKYYQFESGVFWLFAKWLVNDKSRLADFEFWLFNFDVGEFVELLFEDAAEFVEPLLNEISVITLFVLIGSLIDNWDIDVVSLLVSWFDIYLGSDLFEFQMKNSS